MRFGGKYVFAVFAGKCVFGGKHVSAVFAGKCVFAVFTKIRVLQFWWKMHFDEKMHFSVLAGKHVLWFWWENVFLCFGGKMRFGVLA